MIQSPNSASSRMPRKVVYSRWLWQLTKPGMMMDWPKSSTTAPGWAAEDRRPAHGDDPLARRRGRRRRRSGGRDTGSTQSARNRDRDRRAARRSCERRASRPGTRPRGSPGSKASGARKHAQLRRTARGRSGRAPARDYNRGMHTTPGGESAVTDQPDQSSRRGPLGDRLGRRRPGPGRRRPVPQPAADPRRDASAWNGTARCGCSTSGRPVLEMHIVVDGRPAYPAGRRGVRQALRRHLSWLVGMRDGHVRIEVDDIAEPPNMSEGRRPHAGDARRARRPSAAAAPGGRPRGAARSAAAHADPGRALATGCRTGRLGAASAESRLLRARAARRRRGDRLDARAPARAWCRAPGACRPARRRRTPTCSPAPTSTTRSTCSGFQFLLQELEASLKHRRVAALEAFAPAPHAAGRPLPRLHARAQPLPPRGARGRRLSPGAGQGRGRRATGSTWRRWWPRRRQRARGQSVEQPVTAAQPV